MADTQDQADARSQHKVGSEEEERRRERHQQDHGRGDDRLPSRRPRDLGDLGPDLLQKLEWIRPRHLMSLAALPPSAPSVAGVEGLEHPTPGFGDRCSSQLSYTPIDVPSKSCRPVA